MAYVRERFVPREVSWRSAPFDVYVQERVAALRNPTLAESACLSFALTWSSPMFARLHYALGASDLA